MANSADPDETSRVIRICAVCKDICIGCRDESVKRKNAYIKRFNSRTCSYDVIMQLCHKFRPQKRPQNVLTLLSMSNIREGRVGFKRVTVFVFLKTPTFGKTFFLYSSNSSGVNSFPPSSSPTILLTTKSGVL